MSGVETPTVETRQEAVEKIDFKMVTFALGGKDYGIDIMKVKEIAKFGNFTYVPNTPPFVAGVYNLRGDIISIIDLRLMFNLPVPEGDKSVQDGLILRLENSQIGVIVDRIDKVVGIASGAIQPPHPIFGDINIKYISGVVENDGRLYIILDVNRVFSQDHPVTPQRRVVAPTSSQGEAPPKAQQKSAEPAKPSADQELTFIGETLEALETFYISDVNRDWARTRFESWRNERVASGKSVQLEDAEDAAEFVRTFPSIHAGELWSDEYSHTVEETVASLPSGPITVWNPGCGKGFETYSLAVALRRAHPESKIKIWASDKDLLSISTAPNLVFGRSEAPSTHQKYIVDGKNGAGYSRDIKDLILFEYHDILHANAVPEADVILARDLLSFLSPADQARILEEFEEKLKSGGILMLGSNERLPDESGWTNISSGSMTAYRKQ